MVVETVISEVVRMLTFRLETQCFYLAVTAACMLCDKIVSVIKAHVYAHCGRNYTGVLMTV